MTGMPGARRTLSKSTGTIVGVILAVLVLIAVVLLRAEPAPAPVDGSGTLPVSLSEPQVQLASVEELPVQVLPEALPEQEPSAEQPGSPDSTGTPADPSGTANPSDPTDPTDPAVPTPGPTDGSTVPTDPGASSSPGAPTPTPTSNAKDPDSPAPAATQEVVAPDEVPATTTPVTVWLDGWSIAALGSNIVPVRYLGSESETPVTFTPLTAQQIRAATATHPDVVAKYLGRLVTPKPRVECTESGCTADGTAVDPAVLADLSTVPRLGEMYQGAGVQYGLYAARIAVSNRDGLLFFQTPGTSYTLVRPASTSGAKVTPEGWPESTPLAYGFGYMFPVDPQWSTDKPVRASWSGTPNTTDPDMFYYSDYSALFMYGLADPYPSTVFMTAPQSLLTLLTSPTMACGVVALCIPTNIEPKISAFTASEGDRCLAGAAGAQGRTALLQQDFTAEVTLPYPILLPGVSENSDPTNTEFTSDTLSLVSGLVSFPQRSTFVADNNGLLTLAAARAAGDASAVAWDSVLPDQLSPCPS